MRVLDIRLFSEELTPYEKLKNGKGILSKKIILLYDKHHFNDDPKIIPEIIDSVSNFLSSIFKDFSLEVNEQDIEDIKNYFKVNRPSYFSIKQYINIRVKIFFI